MPQNVVHLPAHLRAVYPRLGWHAVARCPVAFTRRRPVVCARLHSGGRNSAAVALTHAAAHGATRLADGPRQKPDTCYTWQAMSRISREPAASRGAGPVAALLARTDHLHESDNHRRCHERRAGHIVATPEEDERGKGKCQDDEYCRKRHDEIKCGAALFKPALVAALFNELIEDDLRGVRDDVLELPQRTRIRQRAMPR